MRDDDVLNRLYLSGDEKLEECFEVDDVIKREGVLLVEDERRFGVDLTAGLEEGEVELVLSTDFAFPVAEREG